MDSFLRSSRARASDALSHAADSPRAARAARARRGAARASRGVRGGAAPLAPRTTPFDAARAARRPRPAARSRARARVGASSPTAPDEPSPTPAPLDFEAVGEQLSSSGAWRRRSSRRTRATRGSCSARSSRSRSPTRASRSSSRASAATSTRRSRRRTSRSSTRSCSSSRRDRAAAVPVAVLYKFSRERLALTWREWMTARVMALYYEAGARPYYAIEAGIAPAALGRGGRRRTTRRRAPRRRRGRAARQPRPAHRRGRALVLLDLALVRPVGAHERRRPRRLLVHPVRDLSAALWRRGRVRGRGHRLHGASSAASSSASTSSSSGARPTSAYALVRVRENAESIAFYGGERLEAARRSAASTSCSRTRSARCSRDAATSSSSRSATATSSRSCRSP